ncbi:MAG TPA: glycosyltransferase family 9 protein [Verrucomicrobiae bacterium]|jgi:ADP-heptose:LPS heptosyltransferase|nr:glycosyltransferase family 9 protein [Verrucomicrobiae bacterium]
MKLDRESIQSIILFRALPLGDLLCAVPAMRALRHGFPHASITLAGLPGAREFAERFSDYIDDFVEFPGFPGRNSKLSAAALVSFLNAVQGRRFDLAIQMHGSVSSANALVSEFGAALTAGFFRSGDSSPGKLFIPFPEKDPEIWKLLRLVELLELPLYGDGLEFPITLEDGEAFARLVESEADLAEEYVCIHPGARLPSRRWPGDKFAFVADKIGDLGCKVVFTGIAEEKPLIEAIQTKMRSPSRNLAGKTSLGILAMLLKNAQLLVCNDTGVSHLASALQVPSIVVMLGSDANRWAPLNARLHPALYHPFDCNPCIHAEAVVGLAEEALQRSTGTLQPR